MIEEKVKKLSFEELGGRETLKKISELFYEKVYEHPWFSKFFKNIEQEVITSQQVDFMTGPLGGEQIYCGQMPISAHQQIFITEEVWDFRRKLLLETMKEVGAKEELIEKWLKIEEAFKPALIKSSLADCKKRFNTDEIIDIPPMMKKVS